MKREEKAAFALNDAQAQAVQITDGPALVVAGAGTGKTRVITERIARLISDGIRPENILALTFTEKAAGEMLDRVGAVSLSSAMDVTVKTYNGFGSDLLNEYGPEWGLGDLRLLGDVGELVFLREHFDELELDYFAPLSSPNSQLQKLSELVSKLKQELILPADYERYADSLPVADEADKLDKNKHQEIARFYAKYLELARTHHVITYDDQIFLTIRMLEARPNVLREIQNRYQYMLVDEFQDTNTMQSRLIDLLAGERQNLMVVGDDDQAIYGWRGATLANILDFKQRYPAAADITLIENYRSTQPILDTAYRLIRHNDPDRLEVINRLDKRLRAQQPAGTAPVARHFYTLDAELTWVAGDIAARLQNGADPAGIAVLSRRNQIVHRVHEALELHGVMHAVVGVQDDLYDQPAVQQLIEVLAAINDPFNSTALFHALGGPAFELPQSELAELSAAARRDRMPLAQAVRESGGQAFQDALAQIETWRAHHADVTVGTLAYNVITDSGWKQRLYERTETDGEALTQAQALSEYFKTLKEFERIATVASVRSYMDNLDTLRATGSTFDDDSLDISQSMVNVMSVHKSKGLEWETVYIVDCTEGSFPMTNNGARGLSVPSELLHNRSQADEKIAEERRGMYVAVTRARQELILTYSDRHGAAGAHRKPSRFLAEMFDAAQDETIHHAEQANLELFAPRETALSTSIPSNILQDGVYTLSASQIDCYIKCPRDFYYKHILNIPEPEGAAAGYGTAIHAAIEAISKGRRTGNVPGFEAVRELVQQKLPANGYASAKIKERVQAQALESARVVYDRFTTEEPPVEVEKPFNVTVPDLPVRIKGRMDAVYAHAKGVEVRDYKTSSSVRTPGQAKARASGSNQLTVYALAWLLMHDELPASLALDFVETGQMGTVRRTSASIETLKKNIGKMVESMQTGIYPLGHDHEYCAHP